MRYAIALSVLALAACVDPLPVGTGGPLGPVLGTAPREAVGPGPFLTGDGGSTGGTGIGTAASTPYPDGLPGFGRTNPDAVYVGGQEGVVVIIGSFDELSSVLTQAEIYGLQDYRSAPRGCAVVYDIYGRGFAEC